MEKTMNRYKLEFNEDGYLIGFCTVLGDDYDYYGQMADFPNACSGWTKFADGKFVEDKEKKEEIIAETTKESEIADLTSQLESSNDDMLGFLEDLGSLTNPLTFISDLISLAKKYATLIANRKSIREQIEELKK